MEYNLDKVVKLADEKGISFSITYEECCGTWYGVVESCSKTERYIGKSRSFNFAIYSLINHLKSL